METLSATSISPQQLWFMLMATETNYHQNNLNSIPIYVYIQSESCKLNNMLHNVTTTVTTEWNQT